MMEHDGTIVATIYILISLEVCKTQQNRITNHAPTTAPSNGHVIMSVCASRKSSSGAMHLMHCIASHRQNGTIEELNELLRRKSVSVMLNTCAMGTLASHMQYVYIYICVFLGAVGTMATASVLLAQKTDISAKSTRLLLLPPHQ